MIARRHFLQAAAIAPAALWLPSVVFGATLSPQRTIAICDARQLASHAFVGNARRMGMTVVDSAGDVGALWHVTVLPLLKQRPHQLIGLTLPSDLFLLNRLMVDAADAADARMSQLHEVPANASGTLIAWAMTDFCNPPQRA